MASIRSIYSVTLRASHMTRLPDGKAHYADRTEDHTVTALSFVNAVNQATALVARLRDEKPDHYMLTDIVKIEWIAP